MSGNFTDTARLAIIDNIRGILFSVKAMSADTDQADLVNKHCDSAALEMYKLYHNLKSSQPDITETLKDGQGESSE